MKRNIAFFLAVLLTAAIMTGCIISPSDAAADDELGQNYALECSDMLNFIQGVSSLSELTEYLTEWADSHGFSLYADRYDNVFISRGATPPESGVRTTLHCSLSLDARETCAKSLATALFTLANADESADISVLITTEDDENAQSDSQLYEKYTGADTIINFNNTGEKIISNAVAGSADYILTRDITWDAPSCSRAYEITITPQDGSLLPFQGFSDAGSLTPNLIKSLGSLIAGAKSSGILFELAAFNGGNDTDIPPAAASVTVLVNDNDVVKFTKMAADECEKILDEYDNVNYTITEVALPDKVVSSEDCTGIISLLYTMFNGIYQMSDGNDVIAASNLGTISTYTGNFKAEVSARSLSNETLTEISSTLETICGLSNITYSCERISAALLCDETGTLTNSIGTLLDENVGNGIEIKNTLTYNGWSHLKERFPGADVISICASGEKSYDIAVALLEFLQPVEFAE